jgi:hypothetical protein
VPVKIVSDDDLEINTKALARQIGATTICDPSAAQRTESPRVTDRAPIRQVAATPRVVLCADRSLDG